MTQSRNGHEPLLELIFSTWCRNKRRVFRRAEPRTQRSGGSGAPSGNGRWAAYFASLRARLGDRSASAAVVISENTSLDFALATQRLLPRGSAKRSSSTGKRLAGIAPARGPRTTPSDFGAPNYPKMIPPPKGPLPGGIIFQAHSSGQEARSQSLSGMIFQEKPL